MLSYLWLPYMILPIYAGLERLPDSLLEASADLGGRGVAHVPVGGAADRSCRPSSPARSSRSRCRSATTSPCRSSAARPSCIGNLVYANIGAANNLPFAAALATIPVLIMVVYLLAVRRTGALEEL